MREPVYINKTLINRSDEMKSLANLTQSDKELSLACGFVSDKMFLWSICIESEERLNTFLLVSMPVALFILHKERNHHTTTICFKTTVLLSPTYKIRMTFFFTCERAKT